MKRKILLSIFVLALATMACSIFIGGPDYPTQTVPVSTSDAQSMQTQVAEALVAGAESGVVTLNITESQLTSLVALKMQEQENPPFTDPQVLLRDNQMQLYGKITRGSFTANMLVTANIGIDPVTGAPKIEITAADFGPFPAPEGLNAAINAV
ncbi:MAG: hypothetical protein PHQ36_11025, partial [Anaerolineales bacterium]|nr:hypothetical protein [Anaerolineales bacterium]